MKPPEYCHFSEFCKISSDASFYVWNPKADSWPLFEVSCEEFLEELCKEYDVVLPLGSPTVVPMRDGEIYFVCQAILHYDIS